MNSAINYNFIIRQILHWLSTPTNAYLGSDYGIDLKQYLHTPMSGFDGDYIIAKMRADIPVLEVIPTGSANIFIRDEGIDGKHIYIQLDDYIIKAI